MKFLLLEASTSSAKAMLYDSIHGPLETKTIPYTHLLGNIVSQDADKVFDVLLRLGSALTAGSGETIDMICLSCTWHNLLVTDKNFSPKTRAFSWAYTGANSEVNRIREDTARVLRHYRNTGGMVHPMYPLFKLINLKENGLVLLEDDLITDQGSYIYSKLTGDASESISLASGSGFLNINTLNWDPDSLALSHTKERNFPKLVDHSYMRPLLPAYASLLGVKAGIPVLAAHPDGALNQVGSGALQSGIMTLSVGTSGALRMAYDHPYVPEAYGTWCYYTPGKWLLGAATSGGTNCLDWYAGKVLQNAYPLNRLDKMVTIGGGGKEPPVFLPFLFGERCPGWNEKRVGGFRALKGTHDTGDLYRGILEGVLFNLLQCYEILVRGTRIPDIIKVSGGIAKSAVWLNMLADIFQREIRVSDNEQASLLGAAGLCMFASGELSHLEDFNPGHEFVILPRPENLEPYRRRYQRYLEFYAQST